MEPKQQTCAAEDFSGSDTLHMYVQCNNVHMYEVNKYLNEPCWILKLIRDPHKNYSLVWKVRLGCTNAEKMGALACSLSGRKTAYLKLLSNNILCQCYEASLTQVLANDLANLSWHLVLSNVSLYIIGRLTGQGWVNFQT